MTNEMPLARVLRGGQESKNGMHGRLLLCGMPLRHNAARMWARERALCRNR